jgi:hypothetical protein
MRKVLPLLSLTAFLAVGALAQSGSYVFNNGPSGPCSTSYNGSTYCTAAQTFDTTGRFIGYIWFYFTVKPDGTSFGGHVYINDAGGNVVLTADNFSGTKNGTILSGTFSASNFSGSVNETMGSKLGHCYKGTCRMVAYISSGSGTYIQN